MSQTMDHVCLVLIYPKSFLVTSHHELFYESWDKSMSHTLTHTDKDQKSKK